MSEYWDIIGLIMFFYVLLSLQISKSHRDMNHQLKGIRSTLNRLEDKIDGVDRSSYTTDI